MILNISNNIHIPNVENYLMPILAEELTHVNPVYAEAKKAGRLTYGILPTIKNFEVDKYGGFFVPRGFFHRLCNIANDLGIHLEITDNRSIVPFDNAYQHTINLRPYQKEALMNLATYSDGLLVSPAGSGKTIMGIALLLMCNQKCLWITHTKQLLMQFVDRLQQFLDIPLEDIGLIQKGKWDTEKPITVALVQTMIRNEQNLLDIKNKFGTVILDESHHQPSTTFTKVVTSLNPFYLYGLTATPNRRDNLEQLLFQNVGPIRYTIDRDTIADSIITPTIIPRYLNTNAPDMIEYGKLLSFFTDDAERTAYIATDVLKEAKAGNICIVATERVKHVELLFSTLKPYWDKTVCVVGKHSDKDRKIALDALSSGEATVLICTSHLLGEGFDYAPLNRLFLALPFRNAVRCEQLVGRIQRTSPGKSDALIFDYVDNHGLTKNQFNNFSGKPCRYSVYKSLGCVVR